MIDGEVKPCFQWGEWVCVGNFWLRHLVILCSVICILSNCISLYSITYENLRAEKETRHLNSRKKLMFT